MELEDILRSSNPLRDYEVSPFDNYTDPTPLLGVGGIKIFSECNISAIVGLPKSRKTSFAALLASAYLSGCIEAIHRPTEYPGLLLWIDTEQSRSDCKRFYKIIANGAGLNPDEPIPNFTMLSLRDQHASERWRITQEAIERLNPSLVFVDGIADFVDEQNDEPTAAKLQDFLLAITATKQCHICSIIHANEGAEKPRGHTGSNLVRKCETIIYVRRYDDQSNVRFVTRGKDVPNLQFIIEPSGQPYPIYSKVSKLQDKIDMVKAVIPPNVSVNYSTLVGHIKRWREENGDAINERQCKYIISKLHKENILDKDERGNYKYGNIVRNPPLNLIKRK